MTMYTVTGKTVVWFLPHPDLPLVLLYTILHSTTEFLQLL